MSPRSRAGVPRGFRVSLRTDPQNLTNPRDGVLGRRTGSHDPHNLIHALLVTATDRSQKSLQKLLFPLALPGVRDSLKGTRSE